MFLRLSLDNSSAQLTLFKTHYAFLFISSPSESWKSKHSKSTPTEAPPSHRKHCSWNASSVVLPLTPWLCDIAPCQGVTPVHNLCQAPSLAPKNWFSTAALLLLAMLGACVDQSEETGYGGPLKRQELKQSVSGGGGAQRRSTGQYEKTEVCM